METLERTESETFDVVVVGAGAAGIGVSVALRHAGIENFVVLERHTIGASFSMWPKETRLITPSFPTNSVGMLDLNAVALGVSPAHSLRVEHPTGREFAAHLAEVARVYKVPVREEVEVKDVNPDFLGSGDDGPAETVFTVETVSPSGAQTLRAKNVIWAAGEFQFPRENPFDGAQLCRHTASLSSYAELEGDNFVIIGGYESGVDAAFYLAARGKKVRILDKASPWEETTSDPSVALSTFSIQRMRHPLFKKNVELCSYTEIETVKQTQEGFDVIARDGQIFETKVPPLLAAGFDWSRQLVADLFELRDDGFPKLTAQDGSTVVPGLFICGPAVRQDNHVFCFLYKYRQRFAVVAKEIASTLGLPADYLETYRTWGMYLDDLSCCGDECLC